MTTRRRFLQTGSALAATGAISNFVFTGAKQVAAQDKNTEKNDRLGIGQIGCGGQGNGDTAGAARFGDVIAVCDVDSKRAAASNANPAIGKGKAKVLSDYRKLLETPGIDLVVIGTPDHWHVKIAIEALMAGKHVYCEKPLTLTIAEGQAITRAVKKFGKTFQVGTQQRSGGEFQKAVALCHAGRLGKIQKMTVAIGGGPKGGPFKKETPPADLNWDMWLGQAPLVDYIPKRCHYEFRWWLEYSGGKMTDWGAHHVDIAHWAIGANDTGPVSFEGTADWPVKMERGYPTADDQYNSALTFNIKCQFKDGPEMIICDKGPDFGNGILIEGDQGRIFVARGSLKGKPVEDLASNPLPEGAIKKLYKGNDPTGHMQNFFHCIKSGGEPVSDVFSHHRAMSSCHLANIAIRVGRKLTWDPANEKIVGDEEAAKFLSREQRKGYEIPVNFA